MINLFSEKLILTVILYRSHLRPKAENKNMFQWNSLALTSVDVKYQFFVF